MKHRFERVLFFVIGSLNGVFIVFSERDVYTSILVGAIFIALIVTVGLLLDYWRNND